jgi:hypothetical protein
MKFSKRTWVVISGGTWIAIGVMLLMKGLKFIVATTEMTDGTPLLSRLASMIGSRQQAGLLIISAALLVGFIKGRTVLAKTVKRIADRIHAGDQTLSMDQVYDRKYYVILGIMVGIGMAFRFLPVPLDVRGFIDVTIGSALINGAMLYFRQLIIYGKSRPG